MEELREHEAVMGGQLLEVEKEIEEMTTRVNHTCIENENLRAEVEEVRESEESLRKENSRLA